MRRVRRLAQQLDEAAVDQAITLAARGKRRRRDVAWFLFRRDEERGALAASLADGTWRPSPIELVRIRRPKPRIVARATFADRVAHTALVEAMKPCLLRTLRPESFACLPGLGAHRAVLRLLELRRRFRYALHLDVRSYFPSIDVDILRGLLARRIDDRRFLDLCDRVLDAGLAAYEPPGVRQWLRLPPPDGRRRGLPIGAYTSQAWASWLYLDALDHFVTRHLGVGGYVRYVDDLFLFGNSRSALRHARQECAGWLDACRGLRLKWPDAPVLSCREVLHGLGYRLDDRGVAPLPRALRGMGKRARAWVYGSAPGRTRLARSLASSLGLFLP